MGEPTTTPEASLANKPKDAFDIPPFNQASETGQCSISIDDIKTETNQLSKRGNDFKPTNALLDYDPLRITDLTPIPEPEPVLKINGEVIAFNEDFFVFSGPPKCGKSALTSICIAGAISESGQISDNLDGLQVLPNEAKKAVIHIDTEQARHKQQRNIKTILRRARYETCPDYYLSYNIRQLDIDKYEAITTGICEAAFNQFNGIHSIWIDGGADYVADVNNPETSNAIIKFFEELAIKYHTAVFIIVHTNPGTTKERGNFGSQCQRKSGGILLVKEEGDISSIQPKLLRYAGKGDIPQLMFKFDKEKGYHVGCGMIDGAHSDPDAKAKKKMDDAWSLCENIFSGQRSCSREKAINAIIVKKACQSRTAAGTFALMTAGDMIFKGADDNYRINAQYNNDIP